ncbi:MAG TPA: hydrogenase expression/formation protein HypE [Anaerolineae bacterium]|nr:hydrogenase expression/formation protein HypE [Anaerolineae bacterium]
MAQVVQLAHGAGGRLTQELIETVFGRRFSNPILDRMNDAAVASLDHGQGRLAFSTDGHVVQPLFFPGGDIGRVAVCGTVNDLAMMGARPLWLAASFILEEGLPLADLRRIVESMAAAAAEAGVQIVAGDTKVVERGKGDGVFVSTAGVGLVPPHLDIDAANARPGDAILLSGPIGAHGMTIMTQREGLSFESPLQSDTTPLNEIVAAMLEVAPHTHCLRDPTRGGLATALNELASSSQVGMVFEEASVPVDEPVRAACDLLGLDPLYVANEGVFIAIVPPEEAEAALNALRSHPLGQRATRIGQVVEQFLGQVVMRTRLGAQRIVDVLSGNLLPRIC